MACWTKRIMDLHHLVWFTAVMRYVCNEKAFSFLNLISEKYNGNVPLFF